MNKQNSITNTTLLIMVSIALLLFAGIASGLVGFNPINSANNITFNTNWTSNMTPTFFVNASGGNVSGADVNCVLYINSSTVGWTPYNFSNITSANNTGWSFVPNVSLSVGVHYWNVSCSDATTVGSIVGALPIYTDNVVPIVVINTSSPSNNTWSNNGNTIINFTAWDFSTTTSVRVVYDGTSGLFANVTAGNNTYTGLTVVGMPNGTHYLALNVSDHVNNSVNSTAIIVKVDTTTPNVTNLNATTYSGTSQASRPTFTIATNDTFSTILNYTVLIDQIDSGTGFATTGNTANTTVTPNMSNGTHNVSFRISDDAGNTQLLAVPLSFTLDTLAPTSTIVTDNNYIANTGTPQLYFRLTDNVAPALNYSIYLDSLGRIFNSSIAVANGTLIDFNVSTSLANGSHWFIIETWDNAGFRANSSNVTFVVDQIKPTVTLSIPTNVSIQNDSNAVVFNFSVSDGPVMTNNNITYLLFLNGVANATGLVNATQNNTLPQVTLLLPNGSYNYIVQVTDRMNNSANATGTFNFRVNDSFVPTTAPTLTQAGVNESADLDGNIELNWTADSNAASYKIYRNTSASAILDATNLAAIATISGGSTASWEDNTTTNGTTYWYAISSVDVAGNENKSQLSTSFNATAKDTIAPRSTANVTIGTSLNGAISINWTAVTRDVSNNAEGGTGVLTYHVFRTTNASLLNTSSSSENIANTTGTAYTDSAMTTGTGYNYVITVSDDANNYNTSITAVNNVSITPATCSDSLWSTWSDWADCPAAQGTQTRTRARTCYGGGAQSETGSQACTRASSGSSGGSSGSSSVVANPTATAIVTTVAGTPTVVTLSRTDVPVSQIILETAVGASNVKVTVEKLAERPVTIGTAPSATVYKYLEIRKENLVSADLKSAKISFNVEKSWLTANNVDASEVVLKHFADNKWTELATTKGTETADKVNFEATTTSFSFFAIAKKGEPVVVTPATNATTTPTTPTPETKTNAPEATATGSSSGWVWLLVALVALLALVWWLTNKKKK